MSDANLSPPVASEPDAVRGRKALVVFVVAAAVGSGAVAFSGWLLGRDRAALGAGPAAPRGAPSVAPRTIGPLEQTLIERTEIGRTLESRARAELGRYGWADRAAGVATIPIERAMDVIADEPARR